MKKGLAAMLAAAVGLTGSAAQASVGVIGGADGPTVIFVTGGAGWIVPAVIALLAAAVVVGLIVRRHRR